MLGGNIAIIIIASYFLLRRGGIIMRTWRVASAKFEEKRPERQGKKSDVRGRKSPAKAAIRSSA
jgi:hypothetical protein